MTSHHRKSETKSPTRAENRKVDEQVEETFPASDPPAFMGGNIVGAPKKRESPLPECARPPEAAKPKK
jgi:hypothetical protein